VEELEEQNHKVCRWLADRDDRIAKLEAEPTDEECHTFAGKYHGTVGIKEGVRAAFKWWVSR